MCVDGVGKKTEICFEMENFQLLFESDNAKNAIESFWE